MSTRQIVIFTLGKEEYGIDIMKVVEIVLHQETRRLPDTPQYIEGIINLRGDIYPIYNLSTRFNMVDKKIDEHTKIIIMRTIKRDVGFIVDNVSEILTISDSDVQSTPNIVHTTMDDKYIQGVAKQGSRVIVLLDIDKLVTDKDHQAMSNMMED